MTVVVVAVVAVVTGLLANVVSAGDDGRGRLVDVSLRRGHQPVLVDLDVDCDGGRVAILPRQVGPDVSMQESHPVEGLRGVGEGFTTSLGIPVKKADVNIHYFTFFLE